VAKPYGIPFVPAVGDDNKRAIRIAEEIWFPMRTIFGLGIDDKFIVVLTGKDFNLFEVQVRLTQDPLILVHSISYHSDAFCGFHYEHGFIAAGSHDGKIR
jgi:hypothetical protein